jgi:hypothetical protein
LRELVPLSQEALHRRTLGLQLKATIPYYLEELFKELGINSSEPAEGWSFVLAEPLNTDKGKNSGYYRAPFSVVDESGKMQFIQHSTSTLLHEVMHALGKLTFSISQDGSGLLLRQAGLSIYKRHDPERPDHNRKLFGLFNEALASITQADFLTKFMGFSSTTWEITKRFEADKKQMRLNDVDIWPALEAVGLATKKSNGDAEIKYPYVRLYQGELLTTGNVFGKSKEIGAARDIVSLKQEEKTALNGLRDRQFVYHESGYGVLCYYVQVLAQELWPKLGKEEARRALHSCLLRAHVTGDLKPLTHLMQDAFGEHAGLYVKALANISKFTMKPGETEQVTAFAAFVMAANLPPDRRDSVRKLLASAMLGD